jgi:hypothetical protein
MLGVLFQLFMSTFPHIPRSGQQDKDSCDLVVFDVEITLKFDDWYNMPLLSGFPRAIHW